MPRRYNLLRQVVYNELTRIGWRSIWERMKAPEKTVKREEIRERLRKMRCPKACCNCAFCGWSRTEFKIGRGCIRKRLIRAKSFAEMRTLLNEAWGRFGRKPEMWIHLYVLPR